MITSTFMRLTDPGERRLVFFLTLLILPLTASMAQSVTRPAIVGIASVELKVSDIRKSYSFYEGLLGYACTPALVEATKQGSFSIQVNQRQSIRIEGGLPPAQDERLLALGFETTDVEAMRQYLKSKGLSVPDKVIKKGETHFFSIMDTDKHELKFIQHPAAKRQKSTKQEAANVLSDRILHAGLTISDVKVANRFYADILGFSEIWRGGMDTATNWINMRLPESTDYLEYMLIKEKPNREILGREHHIALLTLDIQKVLDAVRERSKTLGFEVGAPRIGRNNRWQLNLYDPDGTRIEFMEPFTVR